MSEESYVRHHRLALACGATLFSLGMLGSLGAGCAASQVTSEDDGGTTGSGATTAAGGAGGIGGAVSTGGEGTGAGSTSPCSTDCSAIATPDCTVAICNETSGQCEVVAAEDGTTCDDGEFCTVQDACLNGMCVGGGPNTCGQNPGPCEQVTCDEGTQSCTLIPFANGDPCTPADLCTVNGTCANGLCVGQPKDCFFAPIDNECHTAVCNPMNGQCESEPDPTKDGNSCIDNTDLCIVNHTCSNGTCQGGTPKDCSGLTAGCNIGVCDAMTGQCVQQAVMNGGLCDDLDACTNGVTCNNGTCSGGTAVTQCMSGDNCCPANCTELNDLDCATCDWSTAPFPVPYTAGNSVGDMTFDDQCNLYWSGDGGELYRMNRNTSNPTLLHDFASNARGLVYHPGLDLLFVAVVSQVYSIPKTGGSPTLLPSSSTTSYLNGMEVAPAGWGAYGNQLIIAKSTGDILAMDPSTGVSTVVGSTSGQVSDVVFDQDNGTLYAAVYSQNAVFTVSPTGQFTSFATPGCSPDGLAIDDGQFLYIACGSNDTYHRATIPAGTVTPLNFSGVAINGGWAPAGLIFDGLDNLIVMEDGEQLKVYTP